MRRSRRERGRAGDSTAPRRAVWALCLLYAALASGYALYLPLDHAPDESAHRVYVEWLAEHRSLPVFDPADEQHYELHQPPLYYALSLPVYLAARAAAGQTPAAYVLRFVNVLLGLGVVLLAFRFARQLLPGRPWTAVGAAGFVAFLPMHLILCGSVNNDILLEALSTAVLWLLVGQVRGARDAASEPPAVEATPLFPKGTALRPMLVVGALIGVGILTKGQAVMLLPVVWLAALIAWRTRNVSLGRALGLAGAATGVALAIGGWWLVRNQVLYGDPLAAGVFLDAFVESRPVPEGLMERFRLNPIAYALFWLIWSFPSFWGLFGPTSTGGFAFYPTAVYIALALLTVAAATGFVAAALRGPSLDRWQRLALLVPLSFGVLLALSFLRFNLTFFQAQSRYLFAALPFWGTCFAIGLERWAPQKARRLVAFGLIAIVFAVALAGFGVMGDL